MPVTFLIPCLSFIADYRKLLWVLLFVLYGSFVIQLSWAFGAINVLVGILFYYSCISSNVSLDE